MSTTIISKKRMTDVDVSNSFDSVFINDNGNVRQISKEKIIDEPISIINNKYNDLKTVTDDLTSRVDNLSRLENGSTTGDAELQDIRVGADGVTYPSAGEAVRGQISGLKSDLADIDTRLSESINDLVKLNVTLKQGTIDTSGVVTPHEYRLCSNLITLEKGKTISLSNSDCEFRYISNGTMNNDWIKSFTATEDVNIYLLVRFADNSKITTSDSYAIITPIYGGMKVSELYGFEKIETPLTRGKWISTWNGFVENSNVSYGCWKINVSEGEVYHVHTCGSSAVPSYTFATSSGSNLGHSTDTTNPSAFDGHVTIPENCTVLVVNCFTRDGFAPLIEKYGVKKINNSQWKGKNIWWCGTSIPAGVFLKNNVWTSYPMLTAEALGATIHNVAIGSSTARWGCSKNKAPSDQYGITGVYWQNCFLSMGKSLAVAEDFITNYATYSQLIGGDFDGSNTDGTGTGKPSTLNDYWKAQIRNSSYEKILTPYLDGTYDMPDVFVFDHGRNDIADHLGETADEMKNIPSTDDMGTYIGAMSHYFRTIYSVNPKAKIVLIGHIEDGIERFKRVSKAQEVLADMWQIPLLKLYDKLGWSQQTITTNGYWDTNGEWQNSGGSQQTISIFNANIRDGIHPHSDASGKATEKIAKYCIDFLNGIH